MSGGQPGRGAGRGRSPPAAGCRRGEGGSTLLVLLLGLAAALSLVVALLHPPHAAFVAGGRLGGTQVVALAPGGPAATADATGDAGADRGFPRLLIDPIGRTHRLAAPPRRIVSAILAGDEMLADLVPAKRVAAVTYLVDDAGISNVAGHYPTAIPRVRARVEELLALEPDLVLVSTHSDAIAVRQLLRAGVAVARFAAFDSFAEVAANLQTLGRILGAEEAARAVIARMQARLAAVAARVAGEPRPRVLYYGLDGSTGGPGSLTDEMIQAAGGFNVIRETGITGHRRITPELAIALQPQVIVMGDWSGSGEDLAAPLLADPAWQQVPAIRARRVHALRGAWVTSGSQFRVAGVEALAALLHPGCFDADRAGRATGAAPAAAPPPTRGTDERAG
ncbi:MAG: ABC transporter substrate-binding protein [Chromatiaceae bacterium]|nr:MAG: ABC transporter substrate-binding protein [Chromatiaceae bacterium]